jgi:hypothetical protein
MESIHNYLSYYIKHKLGYFFLIKSDTNELVDFDIVSLRTATVL